MTSGTTKQTKYILEHGCTRTIKKKGFGRKILLGKKWYRIKGPIPLHLRACTRVPAWIVGSPQVLTPRYCANTCVLSTSPVKTRVPCLRYLPIITEKRPPIKYCRKPRIIFCRNDAYASDLADLWSQVKLAKAR